MRSAARDSMGEPRDVFFDNLKGWMRPQEVASTFGISVLTIYSWKAKAKTRKVPEGLFIKFNRQLYVRTDVLRRWISSQNDHLNL
jgi:hypothetical protein